MEQSSVQAQVQRGGVDIYVEEAVGGRLIRVRGNSGGVVLERAHEEAEFQKCTADKRGGNLEGGRTSNLCGVLTLGAEDGEMPGDRMSGSSV